MNPYEKLRASLAFTAVALKATFRDRVALFFMLALPVAVIVVVGTTFGSISKIRVGVVDEAHDAVSERVIIGFSTSSGFDVRRYGTVDDLRKAVRRSATDIGVVLPLGLEASVQSGDAVHLPQIQLAANQGAVVASTAVRGVVDKVSAVLGAAQFASAQSGAPFDATLAAADAVAASNDTGGTVVSVVDVGDRIAAATSKFSLTVPQQLVLFTFVNALASAAFIVVIRREGVLRRSLASPVSESLVVTGIGIGWLVLALIQSLFIIAVGALLFDVDWGDPLAAAALVTAFSAVSCGAGLVVGAYGKDQDKVSAVTPVIGIVLGAIGGCMVPLEVFPSFMRVLAHATPHYWAISGWERLVFDGDATDAIAGNLIVLFSVALVLVVVAARKLRRDLTLS